MKVDKTCEHVDRDFVGDYWCCANHGDIQFCNVNACYCLKHKKDEKENNDERKD